LIHLKYQSEGLKDEALMLEQVKLDKDCESWE